MGNQSEFNGKHPFSEGAVPRQKQANPHLKRSPSIGPPLPRPLPEVRTFENLSVRLQLQLVLDEPVNVQARLGFTRPPAKRNQPEALQEC